MWQIYLRKCSITGNFQRKLATRENKKPLGCILVTLRSNEVYVRVRSVSALLSFHKKESLLVHFDVGAGTLISLHAQQDQHGYTFVTNRESKPASVHC